MYFNVLISSVFDEAANGTGCTVAGRIARNSCHCSFEGLRNNSGDIGGGVRGGGVTWCSRRSKIPGRVNRFVVFREIDYEKLNNLHFTRVYKIYFKEV